MRYYIIINPRSGSGKCGRLFRSVLAGIGNAGCDYDYVTASSWRSISGQSRYANEQGYDRIVAMGGDGTINGTINGFYNSDGTRISKAAMGVVYTGTSPDFCRSYGVPMEHDAALKVLTGSGSRMIRTGKIVFRRRAGEEDTETRYFACCANIGLGAEVATGANRIRKYLGDVPGTLVSLLRSLVLYKPVEITLDLDGTGVRLLKVANISVGRTKYIASGIKMPAGIPDLDDRFYILTAMNVTLRKLPSLLKQAYSGPAGSSEILRLDHGRKIGITSEATSVEVEFDGDPAGYLPCAIEMAKDPLELLALKG